MNGTSAAIASTAIAAVLMLVGHSHAEVVNTSADVPGSTRLAAYIVSRPNQEILYRLGVEQDRKFRLQIDCKSQFVAKPMGVTVLSPIEIPDDKLIPIKGVWIVRYMLSRCGDSKIYNALFAANGEGGTPKYQAYFPGSTNAHPVLIRDALVSATANAMFRSEPKGCRTADVLDMRVTQPAHNIRDGELELKGVWGETWTFITCNQTVDVPITFAPNANGIGTSISIKMP